MKLTLEQTWRWCGPHDPVSLQDIKQAGATGIFSALHYIPNGEAWTIAEILKRKREIEVAGLTWSVVESVPVHEAIKTQAKGFCGYLENYKKTLDNLGHCGIDIVCYNFMPELDWTRTNLDYELADGSIALHFDVLAFAAFELFLLKHSDAIENYSEQRINDAKTNFDGLSASEKEQLANTIIAGLPGAEEGYTLKDLSEVIVTYDVMGPKELKNHLIDFLALIILTVEHAGILMCIHPDDRPYSILGLPRVVSTEQDIIDIFTAVDSPNNGLTFCTGSFGLRKDNDLVGMIERLGHRIHFIHLRSTKRDSEGNFHEIKHLEGDTGMFHVMQVLIKEQHQMNLSGRKDERVPMRPNQGHKMLDNLMKKNNPGYSGIGRLRGLAELRGLEM